MIVIIPTSFNMSDIVEDIVRLYYSILYTDRTINMLQGVIRSQLSSSACPPCCSGVLDAVSDTLGTADTRKQIGPETLNRWLEQHHLDFPSDAVGLE
jgi:hypothetical protein